MKFDVGSTRAAQLRRSRVPSALQRAFRLDVDDDYNEDDNQDYVDWCLQFDVGSTRAAQLRRSRVPSFLLRAFRLDVDDEEF
ncbi:MAG: hypothetical protein EZS28_045548 [Streblomastix strix]|uniref:Uncharacterized protein n=1 Tax=Streblomastix strix TaxID=222440 RepID=A0A5J4TKN1_9EUKA|nr:MAG: hypothetical protein EZS28_045548 [Streblomastix strix]